jgi:hypothetical protein
MLFNLREQLFRLGGFFSVACEYDPKIFPRRCGIFKKQVGYGEGITDVHRYII